MGMSDIIAAFIASELRDCEGSVELQRSQLAARFNCVPSQINYVITTRFTPEHGYVVESRRGGGGYIRISRVIAPEAQFIMHTINAIGETLDYNCAKALIRNAEEQGVLSMEQSILMLSALCENSLRLCPQEQRDGLRAAILKQMLINSIV